MADRTPTMIVCCRTSDPDPACVVEDDHVLGACAHCEEEIRVGCRSLPLVILGVPTWCVQCAVELPNTVFVRPWP